LIPEEGFTPGSFIVAPDADLSAVKEEEPFLVSDESRKTRMAEPSRSLLTFVRILKLDKLN
jgi:hypothetical protein